ncbi:helix-turn-helix domain-containing protein [Streptosporangium amethystogenes subsp. fukuiense]|uniref:Helix-turn-helix domain-containing protein n=1 Tax=Streptosporangium amethystogenes subsp. fukuiense TaxID=698418 RepID=A0ABW2SYK3_9ACTN
MRICLRLDAGQHMTARVLHAHRDSLRYRLAQIGKLLQADLEHLGTLLIRDLAYRTYDPVGG